MEFDLQKDLKSVLFSAETIQSRVKELAREIEESCQGEEITVISIINGAIIFTADLIRRVRLPVRLAAKGDVCSVT